jgi:hypothetical protein
MTTRTARRAPSPVVIGQPQALPTQPRPEQAVLFDQVGQGLRSRRSSQPDNTISSI